MSFDTIIKGGRVIDGSGNPLRIADVGIKDGVITDLGRLSGAQRTIDAAGLTVMPGIVDIHTHYDPQLTFDAMGTSSCFHGVTSILAGNCGYSIAPCKPEDREFLTGFFAKVEGMDTTALSGIPWSWTSFPSFLDAMRGKLGINAAFYIGHSAIRRWVMGAAASERHATADEIAQMAGMVGEAMAAGAAGFTSSLAPTHVDQWNKPTPPRQGSFQEIVALTETAGEGGAGSIGFLPSTMVRGLDEEDRARLIDLALRCGLPIIVQGMGAKLGNPTAWPDQQRFLAHARARGAAIFSKLQTRPMMRPFSWKRGTSLYDGVFHWRDVSGMPLAERTARMKDTAFRQQLRHAYDHPNTDGNLGSTLPPPKSERVFHKESGKSLAELSRERTAHPSDVMCELALAGRLETQFVWNTDTEEWRTANAESQKSPHMIIGTGGGGAHLDRDDGAEWSTYYIRSWLLDRQVLPLEEGIRKLTHIPALICGFARRGLLAPGYQADVMMFDANRIGLGTKTLVRDFPGNAERWTSRPQGVKRVMVNGEVIVEDNQLTGAMPGQVVRIGRAR